MARTNRQETAEKLRGVPLVQIDYETGEYIGEYPSFAAAENDNDLQPTHLSNSFNRGSTTFMAYHHGKKLLFVKKDAYERLFKKISL